MAPASTPFFKSVENRKRRLWCGRWNNVSNPGCINRDVARLHFFYLIFVDIDANHIISRLGKTSTRNQSYISCSY